MSSSGSSMNSGADLGVNTSRRSGKSTRSSSSDENQRKNKQSSRREKMHYSDDDYDYEISYDISIASRQKRKSPAKKVDRHFSQVESWSCVSKDSGIESEALFPEATLEKSRESKSRKKRSEKRGLPRSEAIRSVTNRNQKFGQPAHSRSTEAALQVISREMFDEFFLGAMKERTVRKFLKANEFRLYYKMPRLRSEIVTRLPLQIGYMSSVGKMYHFPVACTNSGTSQQAWHVITGERQVVVFSTLSALLRYHKIYSYINPRTGNIETFPVSNCASED